MVNLLGIGKLNTVYKLYNLFISSVSGKVVQVTKNFIESPKLEFIWTIVPALVLVVLAIPSINYLYKFDTFVPFDSSIVTVKVVGGQWLWFYDFSNLTDIQISEYESLLLGTIFFEASDAKLRLLETTQPLYLPTYTPIRLLITSRDVLHCFAVPSLGIKMDACPGRLNQVFTLINRQGIFYGQCSELCGVNHAFMPIQIISIDGTEVEQVPCSTKFGPIDGTEVESGTCSTNVGKCKPKPESASVLACSKNGSSVVCQVSSLNRLGDGLHRTIADLTYQMQSLWEWGEAEVYAKLSGLGSLGTQHRPALALLGVDNEISGTASSAGRWEAFEKFASVTGDNGSVNKSSGASSQPSDTPSPATGRPKGKRAPKISSLTEQTIAGLSCQKPTVGHYVPTLEEWQDEKHTSPNPGDRSSSYPRCFKEFQATYRSTSGPERPPVQGVSVGTATWGDGSQSEVWYVPRQGYLAEASTRSNSLRPFKYSELKAAADAMRHLKWNDPAFYHLNVDLSTCRTPEEANEKLREWTKENPAVVLWLHKRACESTAELETLYDKKFLEFLYLTVMFGLIFSSMGYLGYLWWIYGGPHFKCGW